QTHPRKCQKSQLCREYLCDGVMQWEYLIFTARKC
ncbi:hypothetical protein, partial [Mycobacterium canetti]